MGYSVLAAAAAARAGGDAEAALARAWIGSALKIKPILTLEEEITPVERASAPAPVRSSACATTPASATRPASTPG
jgi:hypothetical protein